VKLPFRKRQASRNEIHSHQIEAAIPKASINVIHGTSKHGVKCSKITLPLTFAKGRDIKLTGTCSQKIENATYEYVSLRNPKFLEGYGDGSLLETVSGAVSPKVRFSRHLWVGTKILVRRKKEESKVRSRTGEDVISSRDPRA
jgi:hypothetical protein